MTDLAAFIFAGVSAAFAVVAGLAARRSARAAEDSAKQAQAVERRTVLREVHATASEVAAQGGAISSLLLELRKQFQGAFHLAGQSADPATIQAHMKEWEEKLNGVQPALDDAARYSGADTMLPTSSTDELTVAVTRLRRGAAEVSVVRADIERKVDGLTADNAARREAKRNAPPPNRGSGVRPA